MKKNIIIIAGLFLFITSCSNDDSTDAPPPTSPSFSLDNSVFSLLPAQGITEIKSDAVFTINNVTYNRSTISIIGLNGFTTTATISFDLYYKNGMSVAGTYSIFDEDSSANFEDFISPLDRACMGWTSLGVIFPFSGANQVSCNNPTGTVKIIANSSTNYTIQYTGNFRIYNSDFVITRNVPSTINITGNVEIN